MNFKEKNKFNLWILDNDPQINNRQRGVIYLSDEELNKIKQHKYYNFDFDMNMHIIPANNHFQVDDILGVFYGYQVV